MKLENSMSSPGVEPSGFRHAVQSLNLLSCFVSPSSFKQAPKLFPTLGLNGEQLMQTKTNSVAVSPRANYRHKNVPSTLQIHALTR
jgi:hypothetical protein